MASKFAFICTTTIAIMAAVSPVFATDYDVGDDAGWRLGFNYTVWAQGKQFFVGDTLIFSYMVGKHNVYKVNGTAFQSCTVPPPSEALVSGNDVITLATPGRKWYICGVGKHCATGMKLLITVAPLPEAPISSPAPAPAAGYSDETMGIWNNWKMKLQF